MVDWRGCHRVARQRLAALGMQLDVTRPARSLSVAELQLLEIARAVSFEARVIVMDEPTASLSRHEVEPLFRVIGQLRAAGVSVLFISHHLDEVFQVADDVTVLRDGAVVAQGAALDFNPERVVTAMFGRNIEQTRASSGAELGELPRLSATDAAHDAAGRRRPGRPPRRDRRGHRRHRRRGVRAGPGARRRPASPRAGHRALGEGQGAADHVTAQRRVGGHRLPPRRPQAPGVAARQIGLRQHRPRPSGGRQEPADAAGLGSPPGGAARSRRPTSRRRRSTRSSRRCPAATSRR